MTFLLVVFGLFVVMAGVIAAAIMTAHGEGEAAARLEVERDATEAERKAGDALARRLDPGDTSKRLRDGTF